MGYREPIENTDYYIEFTASGSFAGYYGIDKIDGAAFRRASRDDAVRAVVAHIKEAHLDALKILQEILPVEPAPYLPLPLPPLPVTPPSPPFGKIDRISLPDRICYGVPIPLLLVVTNTGDLEGNFTLRFENTETKEVKDVPFSLDSKERTSIRLSTIVPKGGTDLKFATFHDEKEDDAELAHVEPTVFGFATINRFIAPTGMRPGRTLDVQVEAINTGECRDEFLTNILDADTGDLLLSESTFLSPGESAVWTYPATMVGKVWTLESRTFRRGAKEWIENDRRKIQVLPIETVLLNTAEGWVEFRGPMAVYVGSIIGRGIEFLGPEKGEERVVTLPGGRFASFKGRAEKGDVDRIKFTSISDFRVRTEIGIASVLDRVVTNVDTKEFKYSAIIPRPLFPALKMIRGVFRK